MRFCRRTLLAVLLASQFGCGDSNGGDEPRNDSGGAGGARAGSGGAETGGSATASGGSTMVGDAGGSAGALSAGSGGFAQHAGAGGSAPPASIGSRLASFDTGMCVLNAARKMVCWGEGFSASAASTIPGDMFTALAAAGLICGIGADQTVTCFTAPGVSDDPSRVPKGPALQIALAATGACALNLSSRVSCTGVEGTPSDERFQQVSVGEHFACGIKAGDGGVVCWGEEERAGCASPVPRTGQLEAPLGRFRQIASSAFQSCGIRSDGTLTCWGAGDASDHPEEDLCGQKLNYGQAAPPAGTYSQVSVGAFHACAVRTDGTVACWGAGEHTGECGRDLDACGQAMPPVEGGFVEVAAGFTNSCGLKENGKVRCWGSNTMGRSTPPEELQ